MSDAPEPVETELLARIADGDLASRAVYTDWLEQRGQARAAAFVRAQDAIAGQRTPPLAIASMAAGFPYRWRVAVTRPAIEACPNKARCPNDWGALAATPADAVRSCRTCGKAVHYCETIVDARHHAAGGEPVALDVRAPRWDFDLARYGATCAACGYRGSDYFARDCLRCGAQLPPPRLLLG